MAAAALAMVAQWPVTCAIVSVCLAMWLFIWWKGYKHEDLTSSYMHGYQCVVHKHQYWRLIVSQFSHIHFGHLLMNMAWLLLLGLGEPLIGSFAYLRWLLIMMVGTAAIETLACHILVKLGRAEGLKERACVLGCAGMLAGMILPTLAVWKYRALALAFGKILEHLGISSTEFWSTVIGLELVMVMMYVLLNRYFGASMIGLTAGWAAAQVGAFTGDFAWMGPMPTACLAGSVVALVLYGLWKERAMLASHRTGPEYQPLTLSKDACLEMV